MNKVVANADEAVKDIRDGATLTDEDVKALKTSLTPPAKAK